MVDTARRTGRLLQIGFQRRSHVRYRHAVDKLLREAQLPGRLHVVQLQWAQGAKALHGWPRRADIPVDVLRRYGYADMTQFRNWIWFPEYCAGPYGAFATQQLDVCHWFLGSPPQLVTAVGDRGFYPDRPQLDSVFALYQFPYQDHTVRVSATMLTTTGTEGARQFERFLGDHGSVQLAENPRWTRVGREPTAAEWDEWVRRNYVVRQEAVAAHAAADEQADVHVSGELEPYRIPIEVTTLPCQAHLENFVAAVRGEAPLNCPAEAAYASHVTALKTLEATQSRAEVSLEVSDYAV
jgi:predicted dehydrogenase